MRSIQTRASSRQSTRRSEDSRSSSEGNRLTSNRMCLSKVHLVDVGQRHRSSLSVKLTSTQGDSQKLFWTCTNPIRTMHNYERGTSTMKTYELFVHWKQGDDL